MPRPIFDIEQYELRGIEPEVFTEDQRIDMRKALARVHGQADWTAQLLGFNGPNYWGKANPKSDFTYNWVGLPETMNEKRQMQTGTFGVYDKDKSYENWPAPFNRSEVKASSDQTFHVYEKDGNTLLSLPGVEDLTYLDDPVLIVGGSYIFDCEIELEILYGGDQFDKDASVSIYKEYGENVWTRLNILKNVNGSITVRKKGSSTKPFVLEIVDWYDISDWNVLEVYRQYLGVWGNKGNQLATDFLFDSLDLHSSDEHYSLRQKPQIVKYTVKDFLAFVGLTPTTWTGHHPEKFTFRVEGCGDFTPSNPVLGNGVGNPWYGNVFWPASYLPRSVVAECEPDCNVWFKSWQTVEDEHYDNGEYPGLCPDGKLVTNFNNKTYNRAPFPDTLLDDFEYNEVASKSLESEGLYNRPPEGPTEPENCDTDWEFPASPDLINNGTFEELYEAIEFNIEYGLIVEGIYDRIPFSGIETIEFTWEAMNASGLLDPPCVSWQFDARLDNGNLETGIHNVFPFPPDPNGAQWLWADGPWATADDGEYPDETGFIEPIMVSEVERTICFPDTFFAGWDDGEYDQWEDVLTCEEQAPDPNDTALCRNAGCPEDLEETCTADGDVYDYLGPPDYENDCECPVECCVIDNYLVQPEIYLGPDTIDNSIYTALCEPADPPPIITFKEANYNWVKLEEATKLVVNFQPSVRNSFAPLRTWKNHPVIQTDEVPKVKGHKEYRNFFVAERNRGTEPEASYRHFLRLPAEYPRNGKEWNRIDQVCNNQYYFSRPPKLNELSLLEKDPTPRSYYDLVKENPDKSRKVVYHEDYANSASYDDFLEASKGNFKGAAISHEDPRPIAYFYGEVTDYDEYAHRSTDAEGNWRGSYFVIGDNFETTGHLYTDIESQFVYPLPEKDYPTYDESYVKRPNITFPEENPLVSEKNYIVSYAYFTADLSASEEAVFEPQMAHCWRNPLIDSEVEVNDECVYSPLESNTAYLLHPTELDYGKRTRNPREPGEISKAQGTY